MSLIDNLAARIVSQFKSNASLQAKMQSDWKERGEDDPYYWTITNNRAWKAEDLYATGKKDVDTYITPLFKGTDTAHMTALDIGSATGRMTRHMKFGHVIGIDISPAMIEQARKDNPDQEYYVSDGISLKKFASNTVDFAFSCSTLNHLPRKSYLANMFSEIYRVLKPGGTARINVRGVPGGSIGRTIWWKSFERGYLALGKIRGVPVPYFRLYDSLRGVCVNETNLINMTRQFSRARPWRDHNRDLWIDLTK